MNNGPLVLDASLAAAFVIPRDVHFQKARALLTQAQAQGRSITAPSLLLLELASAMTRAELATDDIDEALRFFQLLCDLIPSIDLETVALSMVRATRLRAMDSYYVALAQSSQGELVTFDKQQAVCAEKLGVAVFQL